MIAGGEVEALIQGTGLITLVRRVWAYREFACGVPRDVVEVLRAEVISPLPGTEME